MEKEKSIILTILGITGDLSIKKIIPSLYVLHKRKELPQKIKIIGLARHEMNRSEFKSFLSDSVCSVLGSCDEDEGFFNLFSYVTGDLSKDNSGLLLEQEIGKYEKQCDSECVKIFFFSITPKLYENGIKMISNFQEDHSKFRLLFEKPFGRDLESAKLLDQKIKECFDEEQIYRIDHYLHKEIIRDLDLNHLDNDEVREIFKNQKIKQITISTKEDFGVEERGEFYESVGAFRDVGQNHLLVSLMVLLRNLFLEGKDLYEMMHASSIHHTQTFPLLTFGQYEGYTKIEDVDPNSKVETYFKIETKIDLGYEAEIILEAGKELDELKKFVKIEFEEDTLTYEFDPEDYVAINSRRIKELNFPEKYHYVEEYTSVLREAMNGDKTYFVSDTDVLEMWKVTDALLRKYQENTRLVIYKKGTVPT